MLQVSLPTLDPTELTDEEKAAVAPAERANAPAAVDEKKAGTLGVNVSPAKPS